MPVSKLGAATRAFVTVLLLLARSYELALEVNRDSSPEQVLRAYRRVLLKVLPRNQKRKYNRFQKQQRVKFAAAVLRLSKKQLRQKLCMSLDGVVLSMPPKEEVERFNYCWEAASHMWWKRNEGNKPKLAGADDYDKQVPLSRAIPLWGGLSADGFAPVLWHPKSKKTNKEEWSKAVREDKVTSALRLLNPKMKKNMATR